MSGPLHIGFERNRQLLTLTLARPKANVIDADMIAALADAFAAHASSPELKAVLLSAQGPHFSFGASVKEHLPDSCPAMLQSLHVLIVTMLESHIPILVAVNGQCLGGGLEVAMVGNFIFAAPDAKFGQPEISLGVIAPAASCLLPELVNRNTAEDILFSGRSLSAAEAKTAGLVYEIADDPRVAALDYFDHHLAAKSSYALRRAAEAARGDLVARIKAKLHTVERYYLETVMTSHDGIEGLTAFLEKRPAKWENG